MKKATILFSILLLMAVATSCEKDEVSTTLSNEEILLSSYLEPLSATRAATQTHLSDATHFAPDQLVALYITEDGETVFKGDLHTMKTAANDELNFTVGSVCYWPGDATVHFYAWSPYVAGGPFDKKRASDNTIFSVKANQSSAEDYAASDLLSSKLDTKKPTAEGRTLLTFTHALSQVMVKLVSADNQLTDAQLAAASVYMEGSDASPFYLEANVDIDAPSATYKADGSTSTRLDLGVGSTTFAVIPSGQTLEGKTIHLSLDGGGQQHYTIKMSEALQPGRRYTITLRLRLFTITDVQETVEPWSSGDADRDESENPLYI